VANLASVRSAFESLGAVTTIVREAEAVESATHVVLPGVGAFGPAARRLEDLGLDEAIRRAARGGSSVLGICLGMQLLGEASDEAPDAAGIGLFPGRFERFPGGVRIPHLGWNGVDVEGPDPVLASGVAAFANSFCLGSRPAGWIASWTRHGRPFVSALRRGKIVGCQFHPELSGGFGMSLLDRWLGRVSAPARALELSQLALRIVPCLDVRDGHVVKGVRFQDLRRAGDPAARAELYEAEGADELVVLDVGAAPERRETQIETVAAVRKRLRIPLTAGGGVRSVEDAGRLLEAGADKVSINTAAVEDPGLLSRLAEVFGSQCVVLAIDARRSNGSWRALTVGGRESSGRDAVAWAREGVERGAGEILLTSWDRDGTREGSDLRLLNAVDRSLRVPIIASGGIGSRDDVLRAYEAGASAVLAASIFHDGEETPYGIKEFLAEKGVPIRP
jgi:imidazole glycerol phosphate synthase glutamine amidotransferase subunit